MSKKISTNKKKAEQIKEELKPNVDIVKEVSVLFDGRQFLIKLPREISNFYELKKGDKLKLVVNIKEHPQKHINYFEVIKK